MAAGTDPSGTDTIRPRPGPDRLVTDGGDQRVGGVSVGGQGVGAEVVGLLLGAAAGGGRWGLAGEDRSEQAGDVDTLPGRVGRIRGRR